ncbi:MAG TPA: hypothetical protein VGR20_13010 [Acidimicrobiia bacterium]|nr:hypothetical protein [Acidimicrobiia bacterium]
MPGSTGPGLAVLAPLGAALCYGVASVAQQIGARRADDSAPPASASPPGRPAPAPAGSARRLSVGLLAGLVRQPLFVLGLGLDAVGFTLAFVGLRHLPVFVVQSAVASTVAVTAVLGTRYLDDRLSRRQWALVGAVVLGLALVGGSAAEGAPPTLSRLGTILLVAGLPALVLAGVAVDRAGSRASRVSRVGPAALGAVSGLGFGGFALAGRLLPTHDGLADLLADPVLWVAVLYAVFGLGLYGAALQRGSVTAVTAAAMATEALLPSVIGLLVLSDRTRAGFGAAAVAGFAITVGAALALGGSKRLPLHPQPTAA